MCGGWVVRGFEFRGEGGGLGVTSEGGGVEAGLVRGIECMSRGDFRRRRRGLPAVLKRGGGRRSNIVREIRKIPIVSPTVLVPLKIAL